MTDTRNDNWILTTASLPPEKEVVEVQDSTGRVSTLVRDGNLWFFPDYSMYVYYTPTCWRRVSGGSR